MRDRKAHIFLSYRRADSAAVVDHLYDRLVARYGRECIFRDIDNIPLGKDFRDHIGTVIGGCDIVLAIIGPCWHGGRGASANRILREDDPVRIEIEVAIEAGALVIPILVGGAEMPNRQKVPPSLHGLPALNAATLATGRDFEHHLTLLFKKLDEALQGSGKSVLQKPNWLRPATAAAAVIAVTPLLLFAASAPFGIAFGPGIVPAGVVVMALATAGLLVLFFLDWSFSGRIAWASAKGRAYLVGGLLFVLLLPALFWAGSRIADAMPIRDTRHLSKRLLVEFDKARSQMISTGHGDFAASREIVDAMREIDPDSGIAWYFAGEILRLSNPQLFDAQSCFRGWPPDRIGSLDAFQQDFFRYIDNDASSSEATRSPDWGTEICYAASGQGYCPQRTAWIYQLLAHDSFLDASARQGDARLTRLRNAREYVGKALRYDRPEGGSGFTQCMDSTDLRNQIDSALTASGDRVTAQR